MAVEDVMSLRLDPSLSEQVALAAQILDQTKSDFLRDAVRGHLARLRTEEGFQRALNAHLDKQRQLLTPDFSGDNR